MVHCSEFIIVVHRFTVKQKNKKVHLYISDSLVYNGDGGDSMATNKPRYTVSVDDELFQKIEDFRFERRFQTRSEATVELIRLGLEALKREETDEKAENK